MDLERIRSARIDLMNEVTEAISRFSKVCSEEDIFNTDNAKNAKSMSDSDYATVVSAAYETRIWSAILHLINENSFTMREILTDFVDSQEKHIQHYKRTENQFIGDMGMSVQQFCAMLHNAFNLSDEEADRLLKEMGIELPPGIKLKDVLRSGPPKGMVPPENIPDDVTGIITPRSPNKGDLTKSINEIFNQHSSKKKNNGK
jgi:hypothetical protein